MLTAVIVVLPGADCSDCGAALVLTAVIVVLPWC